MTLRCLLIMVGLFLVNCSDPYNHRAFKPKNAAASPSFNAIPISKSLQMRIERATHFRDLFDFSKVTILTNLDPYGFVNISKSFMIDETWVLFDDYTQTIILANQEGRAFKAVGRPGQGPGEYERISRIIKIWGDHIAVVNVGKIDIFDKQGRWLKEITIQVGSEQFTARTMISWNNPGRLFLSDFPTYTKGMPAHGIFLYDGSTFAKHNAFGERFYETLQAVNGSPFLTQCFSEIDDHIWTSNPYRSEFEIYSRDGDLLKILPIHHADIRKEDAFQTIRNNDDLLSYIGETFGATQVQRVGPLIFAFYVGKRQRYCNIYNSEGTLLKAHLPCHSGIIWPSYAQDNTLYFDSNSVSQPESWQKFLSAKELETLNEQSIDTTIADGPLFIWAATLKP